MNEPKWSLIADRLLALLGIVGSIILVAVMAYEMGAADQRAATPACKPKIHRMVYSAEEHFRAGRMMRRMEATK